jgi:hypothetical protein
MSGASQAAVGSNLFLTKASIPCNHTKDNFPVPFTVNG